MAGGTQDEDGEITGINVTPLVDIVLVLLIIFMVTASFIVKESKEVDLPSAAKAESTLEETVNLVMDKEGKIFVDGDEVDDAALRRRLRASVAKNKDVRAMIAADKTLQYGNVMTLIDTVNVEGIAKFALNIQRIAPPKP
ncbi:MAG: biopolymer transporter ExbD [Myxococcales bacterium]|nr:biopolymer transporter ExbD [Myxococcales bacterium]